MKKQATLRDEAEAFELGPVDHLKLIHTFLKNKKSLLARVLGAGPRVVGCRRRGSTLAK